jgi:hypothetical protein
MIATGYFHTIVLTTRGRILQTGMNKDDKGETLLNTIFTELPNLPRDYITNVKAKEYSVALNNTG